MTELDLQARGYLIDLDGTLISGRTVLPDARWLLDGVAGRYVLVSNNAEHTPAQLSRMLQAMGLKVSADRIVLAGTCAIDRIASAFPGASVMLLGSRALCSYARRKGLHLSTARADIVLVTRDRQFTYAKLEAAAGALTDGARLFVAARISITLEPTESQCPKPAHWRLPFLLARGPATTPLLASRNAFCSRWPVAHLASTLRRP